MDLRLTFNEVPELYDKLRPTYVNDLFSDIFSYSKIREGNSALEIGIGTGQATKPFLDAEVNVTAIEIGDNFSEYTGNKFKNYKNFNVQNISFEDYISDGNTFNIIYSATAFHWIPEELGYSKVYKLLKSGGTFARFRNHPHRDKDNEPLSIELEKLYQEFMPKTIKGTPKEFGLKDAAAISDLSSKYGFIDAEYKLYKRIRAMNPDEYVGLLHTYSDHRALGKEKFNLFSYKIKEAIIKHGEKINIYDTIDLELARKP